MKYFFDTEFFANRWSLTLLSIGIVREDGLSYYAIAPEIEEITDPWLIQNVYKRAEISSNSLTSVDVIAEQIRTFVSDDKNPEFWAYYGAFDWFAFCGLFGGMMNLPNNFPMIFRDLRVELDRIGKEHIRDIGRHDEHNALADALWVRNTYFKEII